MCHAPATFFSLFLFRLSIFIIFFFPLCFAHSELFCTIAPTFISCRTFEFSSNHKLAKLKKLVIRLYLCIYVWECLALENLCVCYCIIKLRSLVTLSDIEATNAAGKEAFPSIAFFSSSFLPTFGQLFL